MKFPIYLLGLMLLIFVSTNASQAQSNKGKATKTLTPAAKSKLRSTTPIKKQSMRSISQAKTAAFNTGRAKQSMNRAARTSAKSEFADLLEDENKQLLQINYHRISFPSNALPSQNTPLSSIDLFDGNSNEAKKIGSLHFYGTNAKALSEKASRSEKDGLQLAYHIDMLPSITAFLKQSRNSTIVYDTQTKEAFLSANKQGNASRGRR